MSSKQAEAKLLVVDDSLTSRTLVQLSFKHSAYHLEYAVTGAEGIDKARAHPPDVVLLDYMLPDMKGSDFCKQLLQTPKTAKVPVIVISAKDEGIVQAFAGCPNAVEFLHKPFTAPDLQARVQKVLQSSGEASKEAPEGVTFKEKEQVARALFEVLRTRLAQIPSWYQDMGPQDPINYFAQKLLTPALVDALLTALRPLLRPASAPAAEAPEAARRLYQRAPGFSERVRSASLNSVEQRLLASVDGNLSSQALADATGLDAVKVEATLQGLLATGMVRISAQTLPEVVIWDPDEDGFAAPLAAELERLMAGLVRVQRVQRPDDILARLSGQRCACVVTHTAAGPAHLQALAAQVQQSPASGETALLAIQDSEDAQHRPVWAQSFEVILTKPVELPALLQFIRAAVAR